jgi:insulysin
MRRLGQYEDVVAAIFEYIEMIKDQGVKKWIFDEIKSLAEIEFKFSEKCPPSQYTSSLSQQMQENLPPQWTISGGSVLRKYDPALIEKHLDLLRPDNFRLTIACQEFPKGIKPTKVEQWYSTDYTVLPVSDELNKVCCPKSWVIFFFFYFFFLLLTEFEFSVLSTSP